MQLSSVRRFEVDFEVVSGQSAAGHQTLRSMEIYTEMVGNCDLGCLQKWLAFLYFLANHSMIYAFPYSSKAASMRGRPSGPLRRAFQFTQGQ